jgi:VanZ family protein
MSRSLRKRFLLCTLGWAAVIFCLSQIPGADVPPMFFGEDKLAHITVYAILGFFTMGALTGTLRLRRIPRPWLAVLLVIAYGVLDEIHQHFVPGRTPDIFDVMADATGGMLGVWLFYRIVRPRLDGPTDRPESVVAD